MKKNTLIVYILSVLLTIGAIDCVYGEPNIMSFEGMQKFYQTMGDLAYQRMEYLSRMYQTGQRESKEAVNNEEENAEAIRHFGRIAYVHPDYKEIINDPKFYEFINNLPEEDRKRCNTIVDRGSSKEVNKLLTAYKQSIRIEAEEKGKNEKTLQDKSLYRNEVYKFRITFPEGWKVGRGSSSNSVVTASDSNGSSICINIVKTDPNNTADMLSLELIPEFLKLLKTTYMVDVVLLDKSETYIGNRKAIMMEYNRELKHEKASSCMTNLAFLTVNNGYIFTITCGTGLSLYKDYKKTFVNSVSTLVFEDDINNRSSVIITKKAQIDNEDTNHISSNKFNAHTWPNGDKYVGEWKNEQKHGQGTYSWANGDRYVGEWQEDVASDGWYWSKKRKIWLHIKKENATPKTDKDAELTKALFGKWKGTDTHRIRNTSYHTTLNPDNSFIENTTIIANEDCIVGKLRLNRGKTVSCRISGKWWVKGNYAHYIVESSTNTKVFPTGHSISLKILSVDSNTSRYKNNDGRISTDYRIKGG